MTVPQILIVEDDPASAMVLEKRLKKLGYGVIGSATTGLEAVDSALDALPDLILMDIQLRGELDGIETAEIIRAYRDIPVVYTTGFTDDEVLDKAKVSQPFGYLVKPYGERELRSAVEVALYKHQVEGRLRQSEERFRKLAELAPVALSVARSDGTFEYLNATFTNIFGYGPEEVPDLNTWSKLTRPGDDAFAAVWQRWLALRRNGPNSGDKSTIESKVTCKDREEKIISIETVSLGDGSQIIAYRDITPVARERENLELLVQERTRKLNEQKTWLAEEIEERLKVEEALRSSEQRFRTIFESAGECIFIKDTAGRYLQVNPYMERLLGLAASSLVGQTDESLYGDDAKHIHEVEARVLQGDTVEEEHSRIVNGSRTIFHDIRTPLIDGKDEIVGVIGISRDVTELEGARLKHRAVSQLFEAKSTKKTLERVFLAAQRDCVVLLLGESGSGKDWFARYLHDHSTRSSGPFFSVNCAAISAELAESELFGHERGAFTGAGRRKRGLLELAEGGSLLLNEIGEMPLMLQSKLLTFLDTRSFTRLGGEELVKVNARILVATNRDLGEEVEKGAFRRDLFYRLNVFPIVVPPLRERVEDIPLLIQEILNGLANEMQIKDRVPVHESALEALKRYRWPGNVRELRNVLERALILSEGKQIGSDCLQIDKEQIGDWCWSTSFPPSCCFNNLLMHLKRSLIGEALVRSEGKRVEAARMLGMTRDALKKQMKTLGMYEPK